MTDNTETPTETGPATDDTAPASSALAKASEEAKKYRLRLREAEETIERLHAEQDEAVRAARLERLRILLDQAAEVRQGTIVQFHDAADVERYAPTAWEDFVTGKAEINADAVRTLTTDLYAERPYLFDVTALDNKVPGQGTGDPNSSLPDLEGLTQAFDPRNQRR